MTHNFELDGRAVLGFDTGLDSRAFAQAKLVSFITEPGFIVRRNGDVEQWKASGVVEKNTMVIWGPLFEGKHLDTALDEEGQQDEKLAAIVRWIQAVVVLGENTPLWPCAALLDENAVFCAPSGLARRCLKPAGNERYVNPALEGAEGAAFTAAAMLYRVFTGDPPFTAADESLLHQDMQDGNFLPIRFAVPGLDPRLAALIQNALDPRTEGSIEKRIIGAVKGKTILNELLAVLHSGGQPVLTASLIQPLSEENRLLLEKEREQFLKIQTASVRTKRFVMRNTTILTACLAALVVTIFVGYSMAQSRARLPSTAGMEPAQVIESYYNALSDLDHQMMEACVIRGTGKNDINMVINLFVITKMRQSYELRSPPMITSAREWQQGGGGPPDSQVFGITDLRIEWLAGETYNGEVRYQVDYILWVPAAAVGEIDEGLPISYHRSDALTLVQRKKGWRIAEIQRD